MRIVAQQLGSSSKPPLPINPMPTRQKFPSNIRQELKKLSHPSFQSLKNVRDTLLLRNIEEFWQTMQKTSADFFDKGPGHPYVYLLVPALSNGLEAHKYGVARLGFFDLASS